MNNRKTFFISDLHLQAAETANTKAFLRLLQTCNQQHVDALYILGDLFEAWIGDDDNNEYNSEIISALKAATSHGLNIYFLHGNRDFLIGEKFLKNTGCQLLEDETVISLYGQSVLLMHGDTLCTDDEQYLKSRKWMRKSWVQKIFLALPLSLRQRVAAKMRNASSKHMQSLSGYMMDVSQNEVKRIMQKHHVTYLIHGHTHKPHIHKIDADTRIVLAAWHGRSDVCVWDETGHFELTEL
jgi:UDP-2,3-diacylglucosamine hydrolase